MDTFSPEDTAPQTVHADDLPGLPPVDLNDPAYQPPSIMGGVDFSGNSLPMLGDVNGVQTRDPAPISINPAFAPPVLPPAPAMRRSHSGAILTNPSELPDSYRQSLNGRDWVNPTGQGLRGRDGAGNGGFGRRRADGTWHGGADWINTPGQTIVAPTSGTIGDPVTYNGMGGVRIITGDGAIVKTLYTSPTVKKGDRVSAGDPIGTAINLRPAYGNQMTNHTHVEIDYPGLGRVVDPTGLIPH